MGIVDVDGIRSLVYGFFFRNSNPISTQHGYYNILNTLPDGASILDIGCGDGIYFTNPVAVEVIKSKKLIITCIDPDAGAVKICGERIKDAGLENQVTHAAKFLEEVTDKYDYVLFMESFPVIDREQFLGMLKYALTLCTKKALLYHNLVEEKTKLVTWIKPIIGMLTLVDFGVVTSVEEQREILKQYKSTTMAPLLSCSYRRAFLGTQLDDFLAPVTRWLPSTVLARECTQYLVCIDAEIV